VEFRIPETPRFFLLWISPAAGRPGHDAAQDHLTHRRKAADRNPGGLRYLPIFSFERSRFSFRWPWRIPYPVTATVGAPRGFKGQNSALCSHLQAHHDEDIQSGALPGITGEGGTILGLVHHPERASLPARYSQDGLKILRNLVRWLRQM